MKYAVVVIFKNQMKLEKSFKTKEQALDIAQNISFNMESENVCYFANTYFFSNDILCVTWYRVHKGEKQ